MKTAKAFVPGRTYTVRSSIDSEWIQRFTCIDRTLKFATFQENGDGKIRRVGVKVDTDGTEWAMPTGDYSMCPVVRAYRYEDEPEPEPEFDAFVEAPVVDHKAIAAAALATIPSTLHNDDLVAVMAVLHEWTSEAHNKAEAPGKVTADFMSRLGVEYTAP